MYLIHWPLKLSQNIKQTPVPKECILPLDIKSVWEGMEECQKQGLTKAIGVSNFSLRNLEELLSIAQIPPALNQVSLRWVYEQGVSLVTKSFNKERMKQNLEIFDWSLTEEESEKISQLPQIKDAMSCCWRLMQRYKPLILGPYFGFVYVIEAFLNK